MSSQNEAIDVDNDDSHDMAALRADYEAFLPKYGELWKRLAPKLTSTAHRAPLSLLPAIENKQSVSLRVRCNECPWDSSCQGCSEPIVEEIEESSSSSSSDESSTVRFDLSQLRLNDEEEENTSASQAVNHTEEVEPFRDTIIDSSVASSSASSESKANEDEDEDSGSTSASSSGTTQAGWDLSFLRLEDNTGNDEAAHENESANDKESAAKSKSMTSSEDSFTLETQQWLKEKEAISQAIDLLSDSDDDVPVIKTKSNLRESRKPIKADRPARVVFADDSSSEEEEWDEQKVSAKEEDLRNTTPHIKCLSPTVIVLSDSEDDAGSGAWRSATDDDDDEDLLNDSVDFSTREAITTSTRKGAKLTTKNRSKTFFCKNREEIADMAFAEFDRRAFGGALMNVELVWSKKLRTTAGLTRLKQISGGGPPKRIATIELSTKIIDEEHRLRATLLHEMCHAAAWLEDGVSKPPHGSCFKKWANIAMSAVQDVVVTTTHDYQISYKYAWACTAAKCGTVIQRHSRSVDVTRHCCGKCKSKLIEIEVPTEKGMNVQHTPKKKAPLSGYNLFVKENSKTVRERLVHERSNQGDNTKVSQPEVMKECARLWRERNQASAI